MTYCMIKVAPISLPSSVVVTSPYIINFLVESNGCGESGANLLCNLILLWDIIHHVVNIIHISGEKHRWRPCSVCKMKVTQHKGCAIATIFCSCVTMLRGDVILQELASRCKACIELQCQIMLVKTFNIHVPVHKRNATCRDTARVSKLDVLTHKSHWLCSTSWKHHVTLWLNVYEKDATWTAALCWRHGDYTIVWCLTTQTHTSKSCQLTSVGVQLSVLWLRSSCSWAPLCWSGHSREPPAGTQWWTGCHLFAEVASPVASFFLKHSKQLGDEKGRSWTSTLYECRLTPISSS